MLAVINVTVGLLTVAGLATGAYLQLRLVALHEQAEILAQAGRRHALADMHHDGLKGSLYRTLYDAARSADNRDALIDDMRQQSEGLDKHLQALRTLELPSAITAALAGSDKAMRSYVAEARRVAGIALDGSFDMANERLPEFEKTFTVLADINEKVGDLIEAETAANSEQARNVAWQSKVMFAALGASLIVALVGQFHFLRRRVMRPLEVVRAEIARVSAGAVEDPIAAYRSKDEIGAIFGALETFRVQTVATRDLELQGKTDQERRQLRQASIEASVAAFKQTIEQTRTDLGRGVGSLSETTAVISSVAADVEQAAGLATAGSAENADVAERIASATVEIEASIAAVSNELGQASSTVARTSELAKASTERVKALAEAANEIDGVVDLIRGIAEQTNLLALNATIEAARAGEAGRGFAVVANEVKTLATRTASATDGIGARITDIKDATASTVSAIQSMVETFAQVEDMVRTISSASEEQSRSVSRIAEAADAAVTTSKGMSRSVDRVVEAAAGARSASSTIENVSAEMGRLAGELDQSVSRFVAAVEAA
jgi:methyl-accepting chemotaxis protein